MKCVPKLGSLIVSLTKLILFDSGLIIVYPCLKLTLTDEDTDSTSNVEVDINVAINFEFGLNLVVFVRTVGTVIILPLFSSSNGHGRMRNCQT